MNRRLRFNDLQARGIVLNRTTLRNWIRDREFPSGQLTGPNTRTWGEDEVDEYLASRPTGPKAVSPKAVRPRGRPRKIEATQQST